MGCTMTIGELRNDNVRMPLHRIHNFFCIWSSKSCYLGIVLVHRLLDRNYFLPVVCKDFVGPACLVVSDLPHLVSKDMCVVRANLSSANGWNNFELLWYTLDVRPLCLWGVQELSFMDFIRLLLRMCGGRKNKARYCICKSLNGFKYDCKCYNHL